MKQSSDAIRTKIMFLRNAIEKILHDREIKRSHHSQLKKACEVALGNSFFCSPTKDAAKISICFLFKEELNQELHQHEEEEAINKASQIVPSRNKFVEADRYFLPFELACQSKTPRIVVTALDCLQVKLTKAPHKRKRHCTFMFRNLSHTVT